MITIYINDEKIRARAEEVMERELAYNPNLSGAEYAIKKDDHNWIDIKDEITGAQLCSMIFDFDAEQSK